MSLRSGQDKQMSLISQAQRNHGINLKRFRSILKSGQYFAHFCTFSSIYSYGILETGVFVRAGLLRWSNFTLIRNMMARIPGDGVFLRLLRQKRKWSKRLRFHPNVIWHPINAIHLASRRMLNRRFSSTLLSPYSGPYILLFNQFTAHVGDLWIGWIAMLIPLHVTN